MWKTYLAVMLGGAIGTAMRMWLSSLIATRFGEAFPLGTLIVNITGCFLIGAFARATGPESALFVSPVFRQFFMVGICGGYTTFSSFSLQTLNLINGREWLGATLNVILSVFLCMLAVWSGTVVAARFR